MTAAYKLALAGAATVLLIVIAVLLLRNPSEEAGPDDPTLAMNESEITGVPGPADADGSADRDQRVTFENPTQNKIEPKPMDDLPSQTFGRPVNTGDPFDAASDPLLSDDLEPAPVAIDEPQDSQSGTSEGETNSVTIGNTAENKTQLGPADPVAKFLAQGDSSSDTASAEPAPTVDASSTTPQSTRPVDLATTQQTHIIASGETFSSIARATYGDEKYWVAIAQANPLIDPDRIRVGQEIRLPEKELVLAGNAAPAAADLPGGATTYTVQSGDTLGEIAVQFYGKASEWKRIHDANRQLIGPKASGLRTGMKLTIPPPQNGAR
jgi:nucleoid-associated protein YgaU